MLSQYDQNRRNEFIRGIRALADWMEEYEDMPVPSSMYCGNIYAVGVNDLLSHRRNCGFTDKYGSPEMSTLGFRKVFSKEIRVDIFSLKENTCERVQVGEKVIEAKPERVLPAEPERVEAIYEWQCPGTLLEPAHSVESLAETAT